MTDELTFLPYLRRGMVQAVAATDDGGRLAGGPSLTAFVDVAERRADATVRLLGPESVTAVAAAQFLRAEPRPDSSDVEPNFFPFVELATAELPWMLTPARPDTGKLRPWLVLVVAREQDDVTLAASAGTDLPVLHTPIAELPDLAESWAWAHVQSRVGLDAIGDALQGRTGEVVARLVCPRRMEADCAWVACVVPAFEAGRLRGLGRSVERGAALEPAWDSAHGDATIDLPVYFSWRFTTGAAGDFEALCRRLKPDGDGADVGRHAMDVGAPGLVTAAAGEVLVDMEGALETPGVASRRWDATHRETFQREIIHLLDAAAGRTAGTRGPDPVVAPPFYGCGPSGATEVPTAGWLHDLNVVPVGRAAAGLGAAVVRATQESLVAAAWDQAGDLRAAAAALGQARLASEVAESWARKAGTLADADLLQLSAPMHAFLRIGTTTVRGALAASAVPGGMFSAAYLRQTRPGTSLARGWNAPTSADSGRLALDHAETTLEATSPQAEADTVAAIRFADHAMLGGARIGDPSLTDVNDPELSGTPSQALEHEVGTLFGSVVVAGRAGAGPPAPRTAPPIEFPHTGERDVSEIAGTVRAELRPADAVRAALEIRVPAFGALPDDGPVPGRLLLSPVFEDPLSEDLIDMGPHWMLPGVEAIARNRVRLVATNPDFVGAVLVGATHELFRELLWRGYPVAPGATFFHRFWTSVGDPPRIDVAELAGWKRRLSVAENMARDTVDQVPVATVIVVRGDLVRRYPSAHFFLQLAELTPDGPVPSEDAAPVEPVFLGALGPDTVFFGFDLRPGAVRGDRAHGDPGYLVGIEEQPGAPRLGLDVARERHFTDPPRKLDRLSWGHLATSQEDLDGLTHASADNTRLIEASPIEGITWGRNAAHLARACWQRPFRMYLHADTLI